MALCALLTGCPDTDAQFERFNDRYRELYPTSGPAGCEPSPCDVPYVGEIDGDYFFTMSSAIAPDLPMVFVATYATGYGATGLEFTMNVEGLLAEDRQTLYGEKRLVGPFHVDPETGCYVARFENLDLPGELNPINGARLVVDAFMVGQLCRPAEFFCGAVDGEVLEPITTSLAGSTFTSERLEAPGVYPEPPVINCEGDRARPLPL